MKANQILNVYSIYSSSLSISPPQYVILLSTQSLVPAREPGIESRSPASSIPEPSQQPHEHFVTGAQCSPDLFIVFLSSQLWCDFDKPVALKNQTFNSSASSTDICSYPEVFPRVLLNLRHKSTRIRWQPLHGINDLCTGSGVRCLNSTVKLSLCIYPYADQKSRGWLQKELILQSNGV